MDLADQAIGRLHARSSNALDDLKQANAQAANDKVLLFIRLARLVLDEAIAPEALRAAILAEIPAERLAAAVDEAEPLARPPDDNYFDLLAHRYPQFRSWAPAWLEALDLRAGPGSEELVEAVEVLRELNRTGRRARPRRRRRASCPARGGRTSALPAPSATVATGSCACSVSSATPCAQETCG